MVKKYNDVTGRKKKGGLRKPTHASIRVPVARVHGVWIEAEAALWNNHKQAFWVDFGGDMRLWVAEPDLVWQRKLLFPES